MAKAVAVVLFAAFLAGEAVLHRNRRLHKPQTSHVAEVKRQPGLHLSRFWKLNTNFAHATFHVEDGNGKSTQCHGKDAIGETECLFKWGESVKLQANFDRTKDLEAGSNFELEVHVKPAGLAAMYVFDPITINCAACGAVCSMKYPKMNGIQLIPTKDDLTKIPMMGDVMIQMAEQNGVQIPQNRSELATLVNTAARIGASISHVYADDAFTGDNGFKFGDETLEFPMAKCPIKAGILPSFESPPMPAGAPQMHIKLDKNSLDASAELPATIGGFDPNLIEMTGSISFKIKDSQGTEISNFLGNIGVNRPVSTHKELQMKAVGNKK